MKAGIGIDLGGTKCAGALFAKNAELITRDSVPVHGLVGMEVGRTVADLAIRLVREGEHRGVEIAGLCVSIPGIAYPSSGTVWAPNIRGWENYPLKADLQKLLGKDFPIAVESDRACSITGEVWAGSARGCNDAILITVGTGIGAGILSGGNIIRGVRDIAGAIGWMALDSDYRDGYKQFGSFEYNASGEGLVRVARDYLRENKFPATLLGEPEIDTRRIFEAYSKSDPLAIAVIGNAVEYWGKAVANLISLFDPEVILFGGGVFGPAAVLIDRISEEAKKWAQPISSKFVKILPSALGPDAALYGSGKMAVDLNPGDIG
jgi:glucokinase